MSQRSKIKRGSARLVLPLLAQKKSIIKYGKRTRILASVYGKSNVKAAKTGLRPFILVRAEVLPEIVAPTANVLIHIYNFR